MSLIGIVKMFGTGISLTPVVLPFTTPMDSSSAIMPEMVSAGVSPGIAIISNPTEHTAVRASSFSMAHLFNALFYHSLINIH